MFQFPSNSVSKGFVSTHKIQSHRYQDSSSIFFSTQWSLDAQTGKARERVFQKFRSTAEAYRWNKDAVVILPVVRSTTALALVRVVDSLLISNLQDNQVSLLSTGKTHDF